MSGMNNMETINDRLQIIVDSKFGGNKTAFARAIGMATTSISNYVGKKCPSKPSADMLAKIVRMLDVDAYWLLTGEKKEVQTLPIYNNVCSDDERVEYMKKLLAEKERTIRILLERH